MYFANVMHKFNLKLGGVNHVLRVGDLDILGDQQKLTLVVGVDVTHPAPKSMENAPSIVGMVASVDKVYGQWPGSLRLQQSKQEIQKLREASTKGKEEFPQDKDNMVSNISDLMESRLSTFYKHNQRYPDDILIYRDGKHCNPDYNAMRSPARHTGVSEGQYVAVLEYELKPIQQLCQRLYHGKGALPKVTIVVVGKRHHTRFYPTNENFTDKLHKDNQKALYNPTPGTVVDRGITMLDGWDFYLQAHAAIKGTVSNPPEMLGTRLNTD